MKIGNVEIGNGNPVMIIAELSANHNHDKKVAIDTIRAAKTAGADAIKLQTYRPDTLTIDCSNEYFQINQGTLWDGKTLYKLYEEAYTPWEWHEELFNVAKNEGLVCFSSPFDNTAVDLLEQLNAPAYKIASFEIQDVELIRYAALKKKPVIISTGIAEEADIQLALQTCYDAGNRDVMLLKCTSAYPAPLEISNMLTIPDMRKRFNVEVGLSDHTMGNTVPVVATSLGATLIEKHFILDHNIGGPDAEFSLDPEEFRSMVTAVRNAELALGQVSYTVPEKVKANRKFARSLFAVENIRKGEVITGTNVRSIRPGYGIHPRHLADLIGKTVNRDIERGTPFSFDFIQQ